MDMGESRLCDNFASISRSSVGPEAARLSCRESESDDHDADGLCTRHGLVSEYISWRHPSERCRFFPTRSLSSRTQY
jgi:hypothetical protein